MGTAADVLEDLLRRQRRCEGRRQRSRHEGATLPHHQQGRPAAAARRARGDRLGRLSGVRAPGPRRDESVADDQLRSRSRSEGGHQGIRSAEGRLGGGSRYPVGGLGAGGRGGGTAEPPVTDMAARIHRRDVPRRLPAVCAAQHHGQLVVARSARGRHGPVSAPAWIGVRRRQAAGAGGTAARAGGAAAPALPRLHGSGPAPERTAAASSRRTDHAGGRRLARCALLGGDIGTGRFRSALRRARRPTT